jgi:hypothetical protein
MLGSLSGLMVLNATFNDIAVISWRSVLLVEETGVPGETHRDVASHDWRWLYILSMFRYKSRGRRGRDRMVAGFTTTYAINAYHHWYWKFRARCTTLCDKVCQWLATGRWFSPGPPVSSTNKFVSSFNVST